MIPRALRAFVERVLPWYDPALEARRNERTEKLRQRAIAARIDLEAAIAEDRIRAAYQRYADGMRH